MEIKEIRSIPTAAEARVSLLAKTVRNAARAAKRDNRIYFVVTTYTGVRIATDESSLKFAGRYYRVHADHAEVVAA